MDRREDGSDLGPGDAIVIAAVVSVLTMTLLMQLDRHTDVHLVEQVWEQLRITQIVDELARSVDGHD